MSSKVFAKRNIDRVDGFDRSRTLNHECEVKPKMQPFSDDTFRVREFSGDHCRRVLDALEQGPAGQTEIAARCGLLPHQVNKRLADLKRAGKVEPTGQRQLSASGRQERVWRVV